MREMFRWLRSLGVAVLLAGVGALTIGIVMVQLVADSDGLRTDISRVLRAVEPPEPAGDLVIIDDWPSFCCDEFYDGGRLVLFGVLLGGIPLAVVACALALRPSWAAAAERRRGWKSLLRACVVFQLSNFLLSGLLIVSALLALSSSERNELLIPVGLFLLANVCTSAIALQAWRRLHASSALDSRTASTRHFVLALALCVSCVASAEAQRAPDLDTRFLPRAPEPTPEEDRPVPPPSPIRGPTTHPAPPPMSVRLLAVEPASCGFDQEVTYDIEIRNISKSVITLPWDLIKPAAPVGPRSTAEFATMTVSLHLAGPGHSTLGGVEALYGDSSTQFTTRRVPPGTSVVIRVPTRCVVYDNGANRSISVTGTPVSVYAFLTAHSRIGPDVSEMVFSAKTNEIAITVFGIER